MRQLQATNSRVQHQHKGQYSLVLTWCDTSNTHAQLVSLPNMKTQGGCVHSWVNMNRDQQHPSQGCLRPSYCLSPPGISSRWCSHPLM
jgi:hypothetical protein